MKTELLRNTTAQLPDRTVEPGELVENVQICPFGDFPHGDSQQHCTIEALRNVVADWKRRGSKEILVDFEHRSEETDDTTAAAWVSNVRVDDKRGLVGDFKMTDAGAEAISNRRLRFLSVSWLVNKQSHEPIRISTIALTNKPNIPVDPILNKDPDPGVKEVEEKKGSEMDIKKITQALGLPDDADEATVLAAIKEGQDAKAENATLKQNALEKEAEDFAEENSKKCNKEVLKKQYIANKEVAKALVAGIPDGVAPTAQKILNKGGADKPVTDQHEVEQLRNKAIGEYRAAHPGCTFSAAWGACRQANPELFQ